MRLALIGADDESLPLVRWAIEQEGAELVAAYDVGEYAGEVRKLASQLRTGEEWESLLQPGAVDLVVIGRGHVDGSQADGMAGDELRADQFRKLLQVEMPILAVHPGCDLLLAYEVDMARRDAGRIALVHQAGVDHPAVERLRQIARGSDLVVGSVEQVLFEHSLRRRERGDVLFSFAQDVALLRQLLGPIQKLSASGPVTEAMVDPMGPKRRGLPSLSNLLVHVTGGAAFPARWSVGPAVDREMGRIVVVGTAGQASLTMPAGGGDWTLTIDGPTPESRTIRREEQYPAVWQAVRNALANGVEPQNNWTEACRDLEVVSTIDRSVTRGRTVELLGDQRSEEDSFKGVMAVGGCLTLLLVLGMLLLASAVEGLHLPLRNSGLWRLWPVFVLLPVLGFLVLQTLQVLVKRRGSERSKVDERGSTSDHGESGD